MTKYVGVRLATVLLLLMVGACDRIQPIYTAQDQLPVASRGLTFDQVTESIVQAAQSNGWATERVGPADVRATQKWQDHAAIVLISHDDKSFTIRNDGSIKLNESGGYI